VVALSQLQLAWLLTRRVTRRGAADPGGSAAARLRAGTHMRRATSGQGARDPAGSVAASTVCGPACEGKTPWVLEVGRQVFDEKPQRGGGRSKSRRRRGSATAGEHALGEARFHEAHR
jgi:hypothetical protein